jgi:hypothetical protein
LLFFPARFDQPVHPVHDGLQGKLGDINDLATAYARVRRQMEQADDRTDADDLRKMIADDQARLDEARREFLQWCTPQFLDELWTGFEWMPGTPVAVRSGGNHRHVAPTPPGSLVPLGPPSETTNS